jgi:hypothetical protein
LRIVAASYRRNGVTGLVRTIERRARQPGANLYAIAAPTGDLIAGNIASIAPGVLDTEGWTATPFRYERLGDSDSEDHLALAQVVFLPNGMRLMVGRDIGEREQVRGLVRQALVTAHWRSCSLAPWRSGSLSAAARSSASTTCRRPARKSWPAISRSGSR